MTCIHGHEKTPENTYTHPKTGAKSCKVCRKLVVKNYDQSYYRKYRMIENYGGNREKVFERDNYQCRMCGMTNDEHYELWNSSLNVDHIDRNGYMKPKHLKNNELSNLWLLCKRCHASKDTRMRFGKWSMEEVL